MEGGRKGGRVRKLENERGDGGRERVMAGAGGRIGGVQGKGGAGAVFFSLLILTLFLMLLALLVIPMLLLLC